MSNLRRRLQIADDGTASDVILRARRAIRPGIRSAEHRLVEALTRAWHVSEMIGLARSWEIHTRVLRLTHMTLCWFDDRVDHIIAMTDRLAMVEPVEPDRPDDTLSPMDLLIEDRTRVQAIEPKNAYAQFWRVRTEDDPKVIEGRQRESCANLCNRVCAG